jgi:DNA-binding response OmpR family regulator
MQQILIVEDDFDIADNLQYNLRRQGFSTLIAETGEKALRLVLSEKIKPSLILLDLMLPGISGIELCRRFRREPLNEKTPIIIISAKGSETDRIAGLDQGADDYIVKPFSIKELIARIQAVLRRKNENKFEIFEDDCLRLDVGEMRVFCSGAKMDLTRKELELLVHLIKNIGRVPTRQQLLDNVWGYNYYGDGRTLDVHIRRLRQKLGDCGNCIETIVGTGYRFNEHRSKE